MKFRIKKDGDILNQCRFLDNDNRKRLYRESKKHQTNKTKTMLFKKLKKNQIPRKFFINKSAKHFLGLFRPNRL